MGVLEYRCVVERFVAAHPKSERVSYEDLLGSLTLSKLLNQLKCIGDFAVKRFFETEYRIRFSIPK